MNDSKIKIAVIDTDIFSGHPIFKGTHIEIRNIFNMKSIDGECGHGTAVCSIILKECPDAELTVFPIFESSTDSIEVERLNQILSYISESDTTYDIINLSSGIVELENPDDLYKICKTITDKGTIMVAAYDNSGIMTYPACFDNVIGVDTNPRIIHADEFEFVEKSPINIRGYQRQQRVAWDKPSYILIRGSSFVAPHITGIIANILPNSLHETKSIMEELKLRAVLCTKMSVPIKNESSLKINKAITFPFNKEIHTVVKFSEDLIFELAGVYDFKYFMRIGKKVSDVIGQPLDKDYVIQSIEAVKWEEDFDTVIIGHVNEILSVVGLDFMDQLIKKIIEYGKNIYAFDDYIYKTYFSKKTKHGTKCFYPYINKRCVPYNLFGKMWVASAPVLAIMGTRSQQGKFTLQLMLKKHLIQHGYQIRHIASEPTGWLFGAEGVFPFGYSNTIGIDLRDTVLTLNNMVHNVEAGKVDLIIAGCQSGTIPYDYYSSQRIMLAQTAFLYGIIPDAIFLCVCPDDDMDYIRRTVAYIESSVNSKVIGIFVFPVLTEVHAGHLLKAQNISGSDRLNEIIAGLEKALNIPVVELNEAGTEKQIQHLINFFE